jgi:hypothetical protein
LYGVHSKLSMRWRYAVLDREWPDVDSKLGGNGSDASPTTTGTIRLMFAIDSMPGFDDGALGSFHDSRRVTQFL